jgi:mRNA interferase RelE/StbE
MFRIEFTEGAEKEFEKLDGSVRLQVLKALARRAENPIVPASRLSGSNGSLFRIKFRDAGLRLIYKVYEEEILVLVLTIGRRDDGEVYKNLG